MATAKVQLIDNGPVTFEGKGYKFKRGDARYISNPADIAYFQATAGFSVEFVAKAPKGAVVAPPAAASAPPPAPAAPVAATGDLTQAELSKLNKSALIQLNEDMGLGADVDSSMSKNDIIRAILAKTEDESDDEESDDDEDEG